MKKLFLLLLLSTIGFFVHSQDGEFTNPDMAPQIKSPEVSALGKYISLPVSLNTGTPEITIPVYTINYGGMQVPITLSYDATGVKVSEIASSVGLKWNLNVGGALSRIIKGAPDEGEVYGPDRSPIDLRGFYQAQGLDLLFNTLEQESDDYQTAFLFSEFTKDAAAGVRDTQPDLFSFNAVGHTGRFYFNENREALLFTEGDYIVQETYDPTVYSNLESKFTKWIIKSPTGLEMTFGDDASTIEKSYVHELPNFLNWYQTQAWHLKKLFNPSTGKDISFSYTREKSSEALIGNPEKAYCLNTNYGLGSQCLYNIEDSYCFFANISANTQKTYNESKIISPQINNVTAGDTEVIFVRSAREDIKPIDTSIPTKVDEIIVKYKGACIKKFKLYYKYYTAADDHTTPSTSAWSIYSKKRLVLTAFEELSCTTGVVKKHEFEYYEDYNLPSRTSFAKDKWSFFNGAISNESLYPKLGQCEGFPRMANRDVSSLHTKAGTLKRIVYPTKGYTEFNFENHKDDQAVTLSEQYDWINQFTVGGFAYGRSHGNIFYTEREFVANGIFELDVTVYMGNDYPGQPSITEDQQCRADEGEKSVEVIDVATGQIIVSRNYTDIIDDSYYAHGSVRLDPIPIPNNNKTYKIRTYFTYNSAGLQCMSSRAILKKWTYIQPTEQDFLVGGLRVKDVNFYDNDGLLIKQNSYTYSLPKLIYNPQFAYSLSYDIDITIGGLTDIGNWEAYGTDTDEVLRTNLAFSRGTFNLFTQSDPYSLNFAGSHMSYELVTEVNGEGSTTYKYYGAKDYLEANSFSSNNKFPPKPLFQSGLAGKLWQKMVYDESGVKKHHETYTYTKQTMPNKTPAINFSKLNMYALIITSVFYDYQPERVRMTAQEIKSYENGQEIKTKTNYFYDSSVHHQTTRTETTNSLGELLKTEATYPKDIISPSLAEQRLISENQIAIPLQSKTFNNNVSLDSRYTHYKIENGLALPEYVETQKGSNSSEQRIHYDKFDDGGNILQYTVSDGTPVSFIWGYNNTQPIAKIENTTYAEMTTSLINAIEAAKTASNADIDTTTESALRTALNTIRNHAELQNTMITTYTYDPLIGLTSITDTRGETMYYEYDDFNRLKQVKDDQGNILSENRYNYKTN